MEKKFSGHYTTPFHKVQFMEFQNGTYEVRVTDKRDERKSKKTIFYDADDGRHGFTWEMKKANEAWDLDGGIA